MKGFLMKFNINDYVKVKLNDKGRKIHREWWDNIYQDCSHPFEYQAPKEDENGYSKWQLWGLIHIFGPHITLGTRVPFECDIIIDEKDCTL